MSRIPKPLPPPDEVGRRVMTQVRKLGSEGLRDLMVKIGIYTSDGQLTPDYGGPEPEPAK